MSRVVMDHCIAHARAARPSRKEKTDRALRYFSGYGALMYL